MKTKIDFSNELLVSHYLNGIKLVKPDCKLSVREHSTVSSLHELKLNPFNIFFLDTSHRMVELNDDLWERCGMTSKNDALGTRVEDFCRDNKQISTIYTNDKFIMREQRKHLFNEEAEPVTHDAIHAISLKMPWYDSNNHLLGIFGCSIILDDTRMDCVTNQLATMANLFLTPATPPVILDKRIIDGRIFSAREMGIIRLIVRGRTMREAAAVLELSPRTVENYFNNIKAKAGVKTRSQLIEKMIDYIV